MSDLEDDPVVAHPDDDGNDSDKDSDILSEIDEDQFEDYDPDRAPVEARPVEIDEDVAKTLKATKRKRADGDASARPKKPKEGKRVKKRRTGGGDLDDEGDDFTAADGAIVQGKRQRAGGDRSDKSVKASRKKATPEPDDETLTPEQRRAREVERAMDAAIKGPAKKRRKRQDEEDLDETEDHVRALALSMRAACEADAEAREAGRPAFNKLKLFPEVAAMLNRSNAQSAILEPDSGMMEGVRFFLEPLNDGSLPAYNIQRELFTVLTKLPMEKELLLSSAIGKVVLFYTRSKKPQPDIKRMAERLLGEWSRPILKRTDDFRKRHVEMRELDITALQLSQREAARKSGSQIPLRPLPGSQAARDAALAPVTNPNRARPVGLPQSYTIAPQSTYDPSKVLASHRPIGAGGAEAFRRMTQKGKKKG